MGGLCRHSDLSLCSLFPRLCGAGAACHGRAHPAPHGRALCAGEGNALGGAVCLACCRLRAASVAGAGEETAAVVGCDRAADLLWTCIGASNWGAQEAAKVA